MFADNRFSLVRSDTFAPVTTVAEGYARLSRIIDANTNGTHPPLSDFVNVATGDTLPGVVFDYTDPRTGVTYPGNANTAPMMYRTWAPLALGASLREAYCLTCDEPLGADGGCTLLARQYERRMFARDVRDGYAEHAQRENATRERNARENAMWQNEMFRERAVAVDRKNMILDAAEYVSDVGMWRMPDVDPCTRWEIVTRAMHMFFTRNLAVWVADEYSRALDAFGQTIHSDDDYAGAMTAVGMAVAVEFNAGDSAICFEGVSKFLATFGLPAVPDPCANGCDNGDCERCYPCANGACTYPCDTCENDEYSMDASYDGE